MRLNTKFFMLLISSMFVISACSPNQQNSAMRESPSVAATDVSTPQVSVLPLPSENVSFALSESTPSESESPEPSEATNAEITVQYPSSTPMTDIGIVPRRETPPPSPETKFWTADDSKYYIAKPAPVLIGEYAKIQKIGEDLPEYVFDFAIYDELTPQEWEWYLLDAILNEEATKKISGYLFTYITISEKETNKLVQALRIPTTENFRLYDGNFDGFLDLEYTIWNDGNSCAYVDTFHFWDPKSKAFSSESHGYSDATYNEKLKVVVSTSRDGAAYRSFAVDGAVKGELHRDYLTEDDLLMELFGKTYADFEGTGIFPIAYSLNGNDDIYGLFNERTKTFDNPEMQEIYDTWFGKDGYLSIVE